MREPEFLPQWYRRLGSSRRRQGLRAVARFIQFRSELAILAVLGAGVAAGTAGRYLLPVPPRPSAGFASPPPAFDRPAESLDTSRAQTDRGPGAAQVLDGQ